MSFGSFVKALRFKANLSLREVASRAGVNPSFLSRVESGRVHPSTRLIEGLAPILQCSVDELTLMAGQLPLRVRDILENEGAASLETLHELALLGVAESKSRYDSRSLAADELSSKKVISRNRSVNDESSRRNTTPLATVERDGESGGQRFPFKLDTIQPMDCIEGMRLLPNLSVDLALVDPPYNLSKGGEWKWDNSVKLPGFGGNWSKVMQSWDSMELMDYVSFTSAWLAELKRVVKPTGSLWIHGTYHNIGIINFLLQAHHIEIINEVIWYKRNSFPNLAGRRLTASHETILWAHTGKERRYLFNYEDSKHLRFPEDGLKLPDKQMRTVWDIPNNKERDELRFGKHPTQKPLRLISRMLALSSQPGQVCLIPFAGSGTECVAAKRAGLQFLAFETDPAYVEISEKRISQQVHLPLSAPASRIAEKEIDIKEAIAYRTEEPIMASVPSLIKWTGSKRSQATDIYRLMPKFDRYFEPFLGGGALLYLAARPGSIAGDKYGPLVELWRLVQSSPQEVVEDYRNQWLRLQTDLPAYFYEVRERFNRYHGPLDLNFLTRTCVNGIVRFNDTGEFNNSFHLSRKGMDPDRFEKSVFTWHERLRGVKFVFQDYEETLADAQAGDFAYLDPPYAGNRQRYSANLDIPRFYTVLDSLSRRGVKWAWSFDGQRGGADLSQPVPKELYRRRILLASGNSAVNKVLNGPIQTVEESLYMNYD